MIVTWIVWEKVTEIMKVYVCIIRLNLTKKCYFGHLSANPLTLTTGHEADVFRDSIVFMTAWNVCFNIILFIILKVPGPIS